MYDSIGVPITENPRPSDQRWCPRCERARVTSINDDQSRVGFGCGTVADYLSRGANGDANGDGPLVRAVGVACTARLRSQPIKFVGAVALAGSRLAD